MLTKWYGMASYCSDNGICRHTGEVCRPTACYLNEHTYIPDEENEEKKGDEE